MCSAPLDADGRVKMFRITAQAIHIYYALIISMDRDTKP